MPKKMKKQILDGKKSVVAKKSKGIICNICTKTLKTQKILKIHIKTLHGSRKDYNCESCGKSFSQAHNLKRHNKVIHEGYTDYKCESCGKSFSQAPNLKKHILTCRKY